MLIPIILSFGNINLWFVCLKCYTSSVIILLFIYSVKVLYFVVGHIYLVHQLFQRKIHVHKSYLPHCIGFKIVRNGLIKYTIFLSPVVSVGVHNILKHRTARNLECIIVFSLFSYCSCSLVASSSLHVVIIQVSTTSSPYHYHHHWNTLLAPSFTFLQPTLIATLL